MDSSYSYVSNPSHEEIANLAREIWRSLGCPAGKDEKIWLEAERQLIVLTPQDERAEGTTIDKRRGGLDIDRSEEPIDEGELQERLDSFGETARTSPTSLGNLTPPIPRV